ncbi:MAG: class I SAM-dependent methyltransferase [Planctomycetes bacterium]|nr:class I SAM-dependent methyltransferase [Planctomycetota bacterium]
MRAPEDLLRCPRCRARLAREGAHYRCQECAALYPLRGEVPWLRAAAPGHGEEAYLASARGRLRRHGAAYRLLFRAFAPVLVTGPDPARRLAPAAAGPGPVIDLGSGNDRRHPRFINVDLLPFPEVDVVAEADALPFRDGGADALLSVALLEHTARPAQVLAEIARVLRPGGRLFLVVPFLQPFHSAPGDYHRWTREGLRSDLSRDFTIIESGVYCGPASACAWLAAEGLALVLSAGWPRLERALCLPLQVLCSPIKWLDLVLARLPAADRLASAVYVEAERRA